MLMFSLGAVSMLLLIAGTLFLNIDKIAAYTLKRAF